jgi:hypothetical protein
MTHRKLKVRGNMSTIVRKPITYRITTTFTRRDGSKGVESRLFNFSSEPTRLRLRIIARGLVDPDMAGLTYVGHEAKRIG